MITASPVPQRRMEITRQLAWALAVLAVGLGGCPTTADATRNEGPCVQLGQTCTISKGLLGVCSPPAPGTCAKEPCFVCMPQH